MKTRPMHVLYPLFVLALSILSLACESSVTAPDLQVQGTAETTAEVRGAVASVEPSSSTFTVEGDTRVRVSSQTTFEAGSDLGSLAEVAAALAADAKIRSEARGTFRDGILLASTVRFDSEADGGAGGDAEPTTVEVEGAVTSASSASGAVSLLGGSEIRVTDQTTIEARGDLHSVAEVEAALAANQRVRAEADGVMESGVVVATTIAFHVEATGDGSGNASGDFVVVTSVNLSTRTVKLADGTTLKVSGDDLIDGGGHLSTLAQVSAAVEAGLEVRARSELRVDVAGLLVLETVRFEVEGDVEVGVEVEGEVQAVDLSARTVVVAETTVHVGANSAIDASGDFHTLAEVDAAIRAGATVEAEAEGTMTSEGHVASRVRFEARATTD